ncbi:unnamed protein product [Nyctereutes procyonoides]|uniref:(raccoon dog) hypothetical protein n=1 Tax=Nyctereutes procyonoides TaxID=34880 RepID=A0A811ZQV8_NYCPR|nr:unnamed protein product [Nyctereutes procyonoides]
MPFTCSHYEQATVDDTSTEQPGLPDLKGKAKTFKVRPMSYRQRLNKGFSAVCFLPHVGQVPAKQGHENVAAPSPVLRETQVILDRRLKKVAMVQSKIRSSIVVEEVRTAI